MTKNLSTNKFWAILSILLVFTGSLKAQDAEHFWIQEDFSSFAVSSAWVTTVADYPTAPNNINLTTFYANVEDAEGACFGAGKNFRVRGLAYDGYLTFTVPDAGSVTIEVKGKSSSSDRTVLIYRDNTLVGTFPNLDKNNCATFQEDVNSSTPVTYKITAEDINGTDPIVVSSITVGKYAAAAIPVVINASVVGGHGTISPTGQIEVTQGVDTTFTITPDAGYKIHTVRVNEHIVYMNHQNLYTFHSIAQNSTIEASFILIPSADDYWINEDFSDFDVAPDYIIEDSVLLTGPNGIGLTTYYANIEESEGDCNNESLNLRIRGLVDGGYASFTVPDAKAVTIKVKGKSSAADRIIYIYRNDALVATLSELDKDHCATFHEDINSTEPLTYKITGGDDAATKPVVISSIVVERHANKIDDNTKNQLILYPNPVQDYLYIQTDLLSGVKGINIYNMRGQCVITQDLTKELVQKIDLSNLPKGVYVARIAGDKGETLSYKVVK